MLHSQIVFSSEAVALTDEHFHFDFTTVVAFYSGYFYIKLLECHPLAAGQSKAGVHICTLRHRHAYIVNAFFDSFLRNRHGHGFRCNASARFRNFGGRGDRIQCFKGVKCAGIVLVSCAVKFAGKLRCINSDCDIVDGKTLILVAGFFLHVALDDNSFGFVVSVEKRIFSIFNVKIFATDFHCPFNCLVEFCIAVDTCDLDGILYCQIALVNNLERLKLIGAARLPKDVLAVHLLCGDAAVVVRFCLYPVQGIVGKRLRFVGRINDVHIQRTGLNLVHRCACGVCKPGKGCGDKHCHAHGQREDAGQQCFSCSFTVRHFFLLIKDFDICFCTFASICFSA